MFCTVREQWLFCFLFVILHLPVQISVCHSESQLNQTKWVMGGTQTVNCTESRHASCAIKSKISWQHSVMKWFEERNIKSLICFGTFDLLTHTMIDRPFECSVRGTWMRRCMEEVCYRCQTFLPYNQKKRFSERVSYVSPRMYVNTVYASERRTEIFF